MADIKMVDGDIDLTGGVLTIVTGIEAVRQDVEMSLATWYGETPYDVKAGVPYKQIIFRKGTPIDAIKAIIIRKILSRPSVDGVTLDEPLLDRATRELNVSGKIRALDEEIDFTTTIEAAP